MYNYAYYSMQKITINFPCIVDKNYYCRHNNDLKHYLFSKNDDTKYIIHPTKSRLIFDLLVFPLEVNGKLFYTKRDFLIEIKYNVDVFFKTMILRSGRELGIYYSAASLIFERFPDINAVDENGDTILHRYFQLSKYVPHNIKDSEGNVITVLRLHNDKLGEIKHYLFGFQNNINLLITNKKNEKIYDELYKYISEPLINVYKRNYANQKLRNNKLVEKYIFIKQRLFILLHKYEK